MGASAQDTRKGWSERFIINILWTWLGVGANFVTGFVLAPYMIRRLGSERYGVWALAFAVIEYFMLFDLGVRSAVVNRIAQLKGSGQEEGIGGVMNTALGFLVPASILAALGASLAAGNLTRYFGVEARVEGEFEGLIRLISWSVVISITANVFNAGLEAFHCFKQQNRISITMVTVRSAGCLGLLAAGRGLVEMGAVVLTSQLLGLALTMRAFWRAFPELRLSGELVSRKLFGELLNYGRHSVVAWLGSALLSQGPPVLIGRALNEAFVGYFTLPSRLLSYMVEMVTRMGFVTMPNAAELAARGEKARLGQLGVYLNRYCLALFMPISLFLLIQGNSFIHRWVGTEFAEATRALLPVFVAGTTLAIAGQFGSTQILFGLAQHQNYARSLLVEATGCLAAVAVILPLGGIEGAAWVSAGLMIVNRGLITSWLLCRHLGISWGGYLRSIYGTPLLAAGPVWGLGSWFGQWWGGETWFQLGSGLGMIMVIYYAAFLPLGVEPEHRELLRKMIANRWPGAK